MGELNRTIMKSQNTFSINVLMKGYCLLSLLSVVSITKATAIYTTVTPDTNWYNYLTYSFSLLTIPILLFAFLKRRKYKGIHFGSVIVYLLCRELIRWICGYSSIFDSNYFEMFFILTQSLALCITVCVLCKNQVAKIEKFLDYYVIFAVASQLFRAVLGFTTEGRLGALGLGVGGTGFFLASYIILLVYTRTFDRRFTFLFITAFVGLLLSGQRTNIFIMIMCLLPFVSNNLKKIMKNHLELQVGKSDKYKINFLVLMLYISVFVVLIIVALDSFGIQIGFIEPIKRLSESVTQIFIGSVNSDISILGRQASIEAGMKTLEENMMGLSNDYYDLQYWMLQYGFPTYPHSTLLASVLLWGPFCALFCTWYMCLLFYQLHKYKSQMRYVLMFLIIVSIIWGGPILVEPQFAVILIYLSIAKIKLITLRNCC